MSVMTTLFLYVNVNVIIENWNVYKIDLESLDTQCLHSFSKTVLEGIVAAIPHEEIFCKKSTHFQAKV